MLDIAGLLRTLETVLGAATALGLGGCLTGM